MIDFGLIFKMHYAGGVARAKDAVYEARNETGSPRIDGSREVRADT